MFGYKKVTRCKGCGKIYAHGIPLICYRCGVKLGEDNVMAKFFLGEERITLSENAENVVARKRPFRGWEIRKE